MGQHIVPHLHVIGVELLSLKSFAPCIFCIQPHTVLSVQVFACTVGQKPSKAPFYVNDTIEVASILSRLAAETSASNRDASTDFLSHGRWPPKMVTAVST